MKDLLQARKTIGEIDRKIAELFEQRMDAVQYVAMYKKENHMEIFDKKREEEYEIALATISANISSFAFSFSASTILCFLLVSSQAESCSL